MNRDYKIVLVLGNGFDLDLGLKTSYRDFMESDNIANFSFKSFISSKGEIDIVRHCVDNYSINKWIDLEKELAYLALLWTEKKEYCSEFKTMRFNNLVDTLCSFLKCLDSVSDSTAIRLFEILNRCEMLDVLSFNYTDLKRLECIVGKINAHVEYIHGTISDDSIILGFHDNMNIRDDFCFMIKSFNPHFRSHNVRKKLLDADEIIFFGHSLGSTDYHYFEDLFKYQSTPEKAREIVLRIFTYDEESRRDILLQLRAMNDKRTDLLYDLCDFEIYRTKEEVDKCKINIYLEELSMRIENSKEKTF